MHVITFWPAFAKLANPNCSARFSQDAKPIDELFLNFLKHVPLKEIPGSSCRLRPYHVENTGSRPITEVKQRRAWLVLRWVTAWEHHVL